MAEHGEVTASARAPAPSAAVVGMGLVVPGARGVSEFWDVVAEGQPVFSEPGTRWPLAGYYDADPTAPDRCSAAQLGFIHPATDEPPRTDHVEEWLRQALGEALRPVSHRDQDRYSLLVGCSAESSQHLLESLVMAEAADWGAELVKLVEQHLAFADPRPVSHLSYASTWRAREGLLPETTDLLMVDTASSSSLYALDLGMRGLAEGSCDIAVCAAVHVLTWRDMMLFSGLGALSAQGDVRPFDRAGDGVLFSDAAAVVVLKRLDRAQADGDPVLGVISGIGLSCDGRGQAIHTPREAGQRLAIDRALAAADVTASDIDLMLAHGTGTPLGDKTELGGLRALFADAQGVPVVSVKSVVGHTGWCAGLVSTIHALSTLQRQVILPQHRYAAPSSALGVDGVLDVPRQRLPFPPRADRPRTIGLSAFGLGGTNAHVIITDRPTRPADPAPSLTTEQVALVAWSAHLPGAPDAASIESWLSTGHVAPPLAFTDDETAAWAGEIRLPPASAAALDRTQLLAQHTVRSLRNDLGDIWDRHRTDIGVLAAHSGVSRTSFGYTLRCALGLLGLNADEPDEFATFADRVRADVPPAGEDAYCSQLPSLISGRIANELDIQGLNMTIDTGAGSMLAAITAARTLLRTGALRLAVVCGVDAKAFPRWRAVAMDALYDGLEPAEGAVAFALTSRDFAESEGLPIFAVLGGDDDHEQTIPVHDLVPSDRNYLAAQLGFAVLSIREAGSPVTIAVRDAQTGRQERLRVTPITPPPAVSEHTQPRRYAVRYVEATIGRAREPVAAIPDRCLIVTNLPASLVSWAEPGNRVVLTLPPDGRVTDKTVSEAVARAGMTARHVRLIAEIGVERDGELERLLALQDLTLLAVRAVLGGTEDRPSFAALLLDGVRNSTPRPALGMFTGFARSLVMEHPRQSVHAVVTADHDVSEGLRLLAAESAIRGPLRIAFHEKGRRHVEEILPAAPMTPLPQPPLTDSSVVVAAGGARGITAPILTALAQRYAPTFWLLGSTDLDAFPPWVFRGDDAWFDSLRPSFIRRRLAAGATATPGELSLEFDRMRAARSARATLTALTDACGADRVRYRTCDVTDQAAVDLTMSEVLAEESAIDLLIFAAGVSSPARIADRTLADFRATRDVKIRGYLNLRHALAAHPPRLWCNFGSALSFTGEDGDSGYAAGNGYLATAASAHEHCEEWTIGWNWSSQDGLLARPVVRESKVRRWGDQGMLTAAGIDLFLEELGHARREPFTLYLSPAHVVTIDARLPGFAATKPPQDEKLTDPHGRG